MKDDPLRRELYQELRQVRRRSGPFGIERTATSEFLTDVVGRGSIERAYGALIDALVRHGADPESDIRAYFDTSGFQTDGDTLDQRLKAYAAAHHVEQRTSLRRSDRGAEKLSYILRDTLTIERPWGKIAISEVDGLVIAGVQVDVLHNAQWRIPHVHINDVFQDGCEWELHDSPTSEFFATAKENFYNIPLRPPENPGDDELKIQVFWVMPVWPIWVVSTGLTTPGLMSSFITERNSGATITLSRTARSRLMHYGDAYEVRQGPTTRTTSRALTSSSTATRMSSTSSMASS